MNPKIVHAKYFSCACIFLYLCAGLRPKYREVVERRYTELLLRLTYRRHLSAGPTANKDGAGCTAVAAAAAAGAATAAAAAAHTGAVAFGSSSNATPLAPHQRTSLSLTGRHTRRATIPRRASVQLK